jgi:hypothetical protein
MASEHARSEQQEHLELEPEAPADDPRGWQRHDPDRARHATGVPSGRQVTPPDGGEPLDREPTEIAEDAGTGTAVGPEQQAVRVETGDERSGRTGD